MCLAATGLSLKASLKPNSQQISTAALLAASCNANQHLTHLSASQTAANPRLPRLSSPHIASSNLSKPSILAGCMHACARFRRPLQELGSHSLMLRP